MNNPDDPVVAHSRTWVDKVIGFADRLSLVGGYIAMGCLLVLTLLMLGQVVVAALSKVTTSIRGDIPVGWEYGSYLMGATFLLGSGITLRAGRHIRLGIALANVPPRWAVAMEFFSSVVGTLFVAFLVYSLSGAALQSIRTGSKSIGSGTPLWIPMVIFAVGSLILLIQLAARLLAIATGRQVEDPSLRGSPLEAE